MTNDVDRIRVCDAHTTESQKLYNNEMNETITNKFFVFYYYVLFSSNVKIDDNFSNENNIKWKWEKEETKKYWNN